jgi:hypothetical protein
MEWAKTLFLFVFTLAVFISMTSYFHHPTYGDVALHLHNRQRARARERVNMFFFSLVRNRRTISASIRCIYQTSLRASLMLPEPDDSFFLCYDSLSPSLSLIFYLIFLEK